MAHAPFGALLRELQRISSPEVGGGLTDTQLLEDFVTRQDPAAFELIVWRHGVMVFNVCLRVLRQPQDAEDAFQATFLALVRKAALISKRVALASWLYKVAYRIALRARAEAVQRAAIGPLLHDVAAPVCADQMVWRDLCAVLDEEVQRLPEKYRLPFVLFHLEGRSLQEVARHLGVPQGTIGTWLARARQRLRSRLVRRGLTLSPALLTTILAERAARAAISVALVTVTVAAARLGTARKAVAAGVISSRVAVWTEGALRAMLMTRLKLATTLLLVLCLALTGTALLTHRVLAGDEPAALKSLPVAAAPRKSGATTLRWHFEKGKPFYQTMETRTDQTITVMGSDVRQTQNQTFYYSWGLAGGPAARDADLILKQKIEGVKTVIDISGNKIEFDSTRPENASDALAEFFKALVGAEFRVTVATGMKVTGIAATEQSVKKFAATKGNPTFAAIAAQCLTDRALRYVAEECLTPLPTVPVKPGDSWSKKSKLDMGPVGTFETTNLYTYEGTQAGIARIKVCGIVTVVPLAAGEANSALPFKIKGAVFKSQKVTGTILFDVARGRPIRSELTQDLRGSLTVEIGGQDTEVALTQTQTTTIETSDVNPLDREQKGKGDPTRELEDLKQENERLRRQLQAVREALDGAMKKRKD